MTRQCLTHWLLMLATALAVQAGGETTVEASCGDYLIDHANHYGQPIVAVIPVEELPQETPGPFHKIPCDGPNCQKAPTEPISPIPVRISIPDLERVGCLSGELLLPNADRSLREAHHEVSLLAGHLLCIEHPPRS